MTLRPILPNRVKGLLRSTLTVSLLLSAAACSSDPKLYVLAPVAGPVAAGGPAVVEVRTPVVAQRLDRDTIVREDKQYRMTLATGDSWGESLGDMIGQILRTDLSARLPGTTVFAQNDAVTTTPGAFVELTISQFEADAADYAVLSGALSVHPAAKMVGPVMTYPVQWRSDTKVGKRTDRLVAALSQGLASVADQAASHLRALPAVSPQKGS